MPANKVRRAPDLRSAMAGRKLVGYQSIGGDFEPVQEGGTIMAMEHKFPVQLRLQDGRCVRGLRLVDGKVVAEVEGGGDTSHVSITAVRRVADGALCQLISAAAERLGA